MRKVIREDHAGSWNVLQNGGKRIQMCAGSLLKYYILLGATIVNQLNIIACNIFRSSNNNNDKQQNIAPKAQWTVSVTTIQPLRNAASYLSLIWFMLLVCFANGPLSLFYIGMCLCLCTHVRIQQHFGQLNPPNVICYLLFVICYCYCNSYCFYLICLGVWCDAVRCGIAHH